MMIEIDDDFADEITVTNMAQSYVRIVEMMKIGKTWHEDDIAAWNELLPAIKLVGGWYSTDFYKEIKKARKKK